MAGSGPFSFPVRHLGSPAVYPYCYLQAKATPRVSSCDVELYTKKHQYRVHKDVAFCTSMCVQRLACRAISASAQHLVTCRLRNCPLDDQSEPATLRSSFRLVPATTNCVASRRTRFRRNDGSHKRTDKIRRNEIR